MREIRTFELEHDEPAAAWRVSQPLVLSVMAGEVWLTVEGNADDTGSLRANRSGCRGARLRGSAQGGTARASRLHLPAAVGKARGR